MSVLTPAGSRPDERAGPPPPPPEPRERLTRSIGRFTDDPDTRRLLVALTVGALAFIGLLAAFLILRGGSDDEATLTAPPIDAAATAAESSGADQLANRSDDGGGVTASSADGDAAADSAAGDGTAAEETGAAEGPAAGGQGDATSLPPSTLAPTAAGPPTTSAGATSTAPTTTPPTSPPTTAPPTTAPTTAPPTTAPPTTQAPPTSPPQTPPPAPSGGSSAQQVLDIVNAERAQAGCGAVTLNGQLNNAALAHSQDMSANGYFSHTGLNGSQPWDRAEAAGYNYRSIGENIAQGYGSPAAVMDGWMNSSGHRANILNCGFTEMGLGLAGNNYWTQLFGRPG